MINLKASFCHFTGEVCLITSTLCISDADLNLSSRIEKIEAMTFEKTRTTLDNFSYKRQMSCHCLTFKLRCFVSIMRRMYTDSSGDLPPTISQTQAEATVARYSRHPSPFPASDHLLTLQKWRLIRKQMKLCSSAVCEGISVISSHGRVGGLIHYCSRT